MNKIKKLISANRKAFVISFIYVGIGTLAVCSISGSDMFYGDWSGYVLFLTFPVTILSFGYRYAEADYLLPVLFIQFIMFIITFLCLSELMENRGK